MGLGKSLLRPFLYQGQKVCFFFSGNAHMGNIFHFGGPVVSVVLVTQKATTKDTNGRLAVFQ